MKTYLEDRDVPDLWSQIETLAFSSVSPIMSTRDTSMFSESEKVQARIAVQTFQQSIIENFNPPQEQLEYITDQLKYLADAVDRLNKFDWRGLALSIVVGIAINLTVDTEGGRLLFKLFEQAFQSALLLLPK